MFLNFLADLTSEFEEVFAKIDPDESPRERQYRLKQEAAQEALRKSEQEKADRMRRAAEVFTTDYTERGK